LSGVQTGEVRKNVNGHSKHSRHGKKNPTVFSTTPPGGTGVRKKRTKWDKGRHIYG